MQDKNKYKTPKYRFVVRFSNKDIICQIFSSDLTHDKCIAAAYSHELTNYGLNLGLTNYAAAYCTGLLCARRLNTKLGLAELYEGNTEELGEYFEVEADEERNPFCCILDVGLKPTTTGSRMFGALKGACDGGLDIPHGDRRYPRPKSDGGKDYEPDAEFHKKYIFAGHVAEYMTKLKDDDEEAYKKQFGRFIKAGIEPEDLEGLYEAAHKSIREEPFKARDALKLGRFGVRDKPKDADVVYENKKWACHPIKLTIDQRKGRIREKLKAMGKHKVSKTMGKKKVEEKFLKRSKTFTQMNKQERQERRKQIAEAIEKKRKLGAKKTPEERKAYREAHPLKKGRNNSKAAKIAAREARKKTQASDE